MSNKTKKEVNRSVILEDGSVQVRIAVNKYDSNGFILHTAYEYLTYPSNSNYAITLKDMRQKTLSEMTNEGFAEYQSKLHELNKTIVL